MRLARNIENCAEADRVFHDFGEGFVGGFQREVLDLWPHAGERGEAQLPAGPVQ
jgi:hypothetical protein